MNSVQLTLGWKKRIVNQILWSKLWYWSDIYYFTIYRRWNWKNNSSNLHLEEWTRYFRHRYSIKLSRTYMDLKIIKPHQCSLERFDATLIELIVCTKFYSINITIYWIKCNADNKTQSFKLWLKPFIKSFTSSSGSYLQ